MKIFPLPKSGVRPRMGVLNFDEFNMHILSGVSFDYKNYDMTGL